MCEDSASFDWSSSDIASAIRDLDDLSRKISDLVSMEESMAEIGADSEQPVISEDFTLQDVCQIKMMLCALEKEIDKIPITKPEGISKPGEFIFELFNKADLNFSNKAYLTEVLDKMVTYLTSASQSTFQSKGHGLSKFGDVIKITFSRDMVDQFGNMSAQQTNMAKAYKVHLCDEKKKNNKKSGWDSAATSVKTGRVLSYWCFSPGHAMEELRAQGVKSIILTSGTLSPMSSFTSEMGIEFPIQLENPHVIDKNQVWIGVVGKGPDGTMLSSSYENRFKVEYQSSLGNAIVNFARVVPHGLLLFFPSYPVMDKCLEHWQEYNMWNRVEQYKPIFIEPKGKQDFLFAMDNFYEKINEPTANGACFAAVCRGKVSEGLDFSDNNGRAVVITGLPFPPRMDPKVILKMQYLDEMRSKGGKGLSGREWYRQQASRAVNQAIGRVIRHKQDYGAIILCDTRFGSSDSKAQLPSWVRPNLTVYNNFGSAMKDMMVFFKNAEKILPAPTSKKKGRQGGDPGCQGAYFQPTVVRSNNNVDVPSLQKSSTIMSHVPSLQKHSDSGMTLARLKIEYERSDDEPAQKKPMGLIDALSSNNKKHIDFFGASPECVASTQSKVNQVDPVKARKRIIVKKSANKEVTKDSIQSAEQYLIEVKKTLSTESYKFFSKTLASYKKTGDFTQMITCLADIFTDSVKNYHLFKKFYKFVKSAHKEQFDQSCRDLTGEGCGYRATDIAKKRTLSGTSQTSDCLGKKLKSNPSQPTDKKESASKSDSLFSTSKKHLDTTSHLNTNAISSSIPSNVASSASSNGTSAGGLNKLCTNKTALKSNLQSELSSNKQPAVISDLKQTGTGANHEENDKNLNNIQTVAVSTAKETMNKNEDDLSEALPSTLCTAEAYNTTVKFNMANLEPSGYKCSKCSEDARIPLKALCQHVCCMECWKICIRDFKHCPECKQKVKRKHLQRVCFPLPTD